MKKFKPNLTSKQYIESQIVKCLNESIAYEAQKRVIVKTLGNENKKEDAIKALTALEQQLKAGQAVLGVWKELYYEENNLITKIKNFFIK